MNALQWASTETFEISGYELETMVNVLTTKLLTQEAQNIIREYETLKMLQDRIQKGLKEGKVTSVSAEATDGKISD